jgi:hypothetical protein
MTTTQQENEQEQAFNGAFDSVNFTDAAALIEAIIGAKPRLEQEFDLTAIDPEGRVQVRIDKNNAPREMVERFAGQMSFSVFPPIVVTTDARIIDGNTRYRARRKRGERYSPALIVPIKWDGAEDEMKVRLEYLGLALNNSNGKALDRTERRRMVRDALGLGMSNQQIVMTVGFPAPTVNAIRHELNAETKLERVGLKKPDAEAGVKDAALRALGKAVDLNDKPFTEVAVLTLDAGLTGPEIKALAASVREAGSDTLALERINRERDANAQRISDRQHGINTSPPAARQLRQRLGYIIKQEPTALVETNREQMADHLEMVEQAIVLLQDVVVKQKAAIEAVVSP